MPVKRRAALQQGGRDNASACMNLPCTALIRQVPMPTTLRCDTQTEHRQSTDGLCARLAGGCHVGGAQMCSPPSILFIQRKNTRLLKTRLASEETQLSSQ